MTTLTLGYRAISRKVSFVHFPKIHWKVIFSSLITISLILLVFYVYSINKLTEGVYLIKSYNKQINTLADENKTLENNFAKVNFLGEVMNKTQSLDFQKTDNVTYVQVQSQDGSLAKAR